MATVTNTDTNSNSNANANANANMNANINANTNANENTNINTNSSTETSVKTNMNSNINSFVNTNTSIDLTSNINSNSTDTDTDTDITSYANTNANVNKDIVSYINSKPNTNNVNTNSDIDTSLNTKINTIANDNINKNNNDNIIIIETSVDEYNEQSTLYENDKISVNIDSPNEKEKKIIKLENKKVKKKIGPEILILIKLAVPIAISEFLKFLIFMISNIFVGNIGSTELAAIALANTYCSSTGWYIIIGLGTGLDTLCSQSFTAAKTKEDKKVLGIIVQRSFAILLVLFIPIALIWAFSEKIFLLLGQDEIVSKIASEYSMIVILAYFPYVVFDYLRRFVQSQGIVRPPFYLVAIVTPINILLHYILISSDISPLSKEKRYLGAPISIVAVYWLLAIMMIIYIKFSKAKECWAKINIKAAFTGWSKFLSLGIPGMFMILTEALVYEIFSIVSGIIGTIELASQSILISIISCVFNVLVGIATAACVRIGNLLGNGEKEMAKFSTNVTLLLSSCVTIFEVSLLFIFRRQLVQIFTDEDEVIELASKLMIIMCVFELADGIVTPSNGILRGCGRQKIGAIMNLITYWVCGIPAGLILAFVFDLSLYGIWTALSVCLFTLCITETIVIQKTNWEKEYEKAKKLYENQKIE